VKSADLIHTVSNLVKPGFGYHQTATGSIMEGARTFMLELHVMAHGAEN